VKEGDRVLTDQGYGTVVTVWHQTDWAFGIPKRQGYLTVELDEGGGVWRRVYRPDELTPAGEEQKALW
jgi:hypothetical protein